MTAASPKIWLISFSHHNTSIEERDQLAFSDDDRWLAVSGFREILLHRADGSGLQARLVGLSDRIQSLLFLPGGRNLVASGGTPGRFCEVQVWDLDEAELQMAKTFCYDTLFGASLSPDNRKIADIIALPNNPLEDIDSLNEVFFVMKDGQIYRNDRQHRA